MEARRYEVRRQLQSQRKDAKTISTQVFQYTSQLATARITRISSRIYRLIRIFFEMSIAITHSKYDGFISQKVNQQTLGKTLN